MNLLTTVSCAVVREAFEIPDAVGDSARRQLLPAAGLHETSRSGLTALLITAGRATLPPSSVSLLVPSLRGQLTLSQ